jgi:hypothetical protein
MSKLYISTNEVGQASRNKRALFTETLNQTQQAYNPSYTARCFGTRVCFSLPRPPLPRRNFEGGGEEVPHLPVVFCYNVSRHKHNDQGLKASQGKHNAIVGFTLLDVWREQTGRCQRRSAHARACAVAAAAWLMYRNRQHTNRTELFRKNNWKIMNWSFICNLPSSYYSKAVLRTSFWKPSRFVAPFGVLCVFWVTGTPSWYSLLCLSVYARNSQLLALRPAEDACVSISGADHCTYSRWERIILRSACVWRSKPKSGRKNIALC